MQDDETNATGRIAAFDPFHTPTEALPSISSHRNTDVPEQNSEGVPTSRRRGTAVAPIFWVAPLEAGGLPLLSPPNMPHMVMTVRDCVMVEERRISHFFLDEVCGIVTLLEWV